jgi:hypothetical protein
MKNDGLIFSTNHQLIESGNGTIELFTDVIIDVLIKARVFATLVPFHPSLILTGKAKSLPFEWSCKHCLKGGCG